MCVEGEKRCTSNQQQHHNTTTITTNTHHTRLVVTLRRRQRRHARSLPRRMIEGRRESVTLQTRREIIHTLRLGQGTGLLPRIQGPQTVTSTTTRVPVLRNGQNLGLDGILQDVHPVGRLVIVRRANNHHVKRVLAVADLANGILESLLRVCHVLMDERKCLTCKSYGCWLQEMG